MIPITAGVAALAVGGYIYAGMAPGSQIFGRTLVASNNSDEFALTYDDGPNDACTEQILEILARHQVRATFFVIGQFAKQRAALVRRIRGAGHVVGNHTWTHPVLMLRMPAQVRRELADTNAALEDILGEKATYFRPPFGARRPDVLRAAGDVGLVPVMWNVMGYDWKPTTAERVMAHISKGIEKNRVRGKGSNLLLTMAGRQALGRIGGTPSPPHPHCSTSGRVARNL